MTTKTKAADLISRFLESDKMVFNIEGAKECALIAVNEILKSNPHSDPLSTDLGISVSLYDYWYEVKQEIENL